jgi:hypothetical protein
MSAPVVSVPHGRASRSPRRFQYLPLQNQWEIRLVELCPGSEDEEISMRIHTRLGTDSPPADAIPPHLAKYIALSYTWGDPTSKVPVLLNGQRFFVGENLHSALRRFRPPHGQPGCFLWVDAICINQEDIREKSTQVQRMKQIYEDAAIIDVWLGPEAEDSDLAMRKLDSLNKYFRRQGPDEEASQIITKLMTQEDTSWVFGPSDKPFDERPWRALEKLFKRPWWSRVWIVQESTTLNVPTYIVCGREWITTKSLYIACLVIQVLIANPSTDRRLKSYGIDTVKPNRLRELVTGRYVAGRNLNTLNLLSTFRKYQATDSRDKVYAIAPLAVDAEMTTYLQANYSKSIKEVYIDAVNHVIKTSDYLHKLDFLGFAGIMNNSLWVQEHARLVSRWPTWLPDWSYNNFMPMPFEKQIVEEGGIFGGKSRTLSPTAYMASGSEEKLNELIHENMSLLMDWLADDVVPVMIDMEELKVKGFSLGILSSIITGSWFESFLELSGESAPPWPFMVAAMDISSNPDEYQDYLHLIVADVFLSYGKAIRRGYAASQQTRTARTFEEIVEEQDNKMSVLHAILGRTTARLNGALALVPDTVEEGDEVFVLFGGQVLYVLRPVSNYYEFIGECYVHRLMDGEALRRLETGSVCIQTITLR